MNYLIDGHNLIGKLPDLRLDDPEDEMKLTARLRLFAQRAHALVTVVFDPGPAYMAGRRPTGGEVRVIYARLGDTADRVIVGMARRPASRRGLTVVTSDRAVTAAVRAEGLPVITSEAFVGMMQPPAVEQDEEAERAHVRISSAEVDAWMEEFRAARQAKKEAEKKVEKRPAEKKRCNQRGGAASE